MAVVDLEALAVVGPVDEGGTEQVDVKKNDSGECGMVDGSLCCSKLHLFDARLEVIQGDIVE